MKLVSRTVLILAAGSAFLGLSAVSASADIACSGNVCWHVQERLTYPPTAHVMVHPDSWRVTKKYTIREHAGNGYWLRGKWVEIH